MHTRCLLIVFLALLLHLVFVGFTASVLPFGTVDYGQLGIFVVAEIGIAALVLIGFAVALLRDALW